MKVFSIFGVSKSGKTTTAELLIKELIRRGYTVGSLKDIHFEGFAIDTEGSNTNRHTLAGACPVTALGISETDVLFSRRLPLAEILRFYRQDYVILEGTEEPGIPAILTGHSVEELDGRDNPSVFAVSGRIAAQIGEYKGRPAIDATADITKLADLVEQKVYPCLPMIDKDCCGLCGFDCVTLGQRILSGESARKDCLLEKQVSLKINGREIEMAPFVQAVLKNAVLGVARELRGYETGRVQVKFYDG